MLADYACRRVAGLIVLRILDVYVEQVLAAAGYPHYDPKGIVFH